MVVSDEDYNNLKLKYEKLEQELLSSREKSSEQDKVIADLASKNQEIEENNRAKIRKAIDKMKQMRDEIDILLSQSVTMRTSSISYQKKSMK